MLSLIRIRVKYLIRHPALLFWTYLFIPLLIFIFVVYKFLKGKTAFSLKKTENSFAMNKTYSFFKSQTYSDLYRYWDYTFFIADSNEDCLKIKKFFNDSFIFPISVNCSTVEGNYTNKTENVIKIEKKKGKYKVYLTEMESNINKTSDNIDIYSILNETQIMELLLVLNELNITNITDPNEFIEFILKYNLSAIISSLNISEIPFDIPGISTITTLEDIIKTINMINYMNSMADHKFFDYSELEQDKITDPFYVNSNITYNSTNNSKINIFLELQSLISKIILYLEGKKESDLIYDFEMQLGYNPYPNHYDFTEQYGIYSCSFICLVITLQFSLITYNFNLRMIDEKENKLNILLERQGISKFKYNASWLITYYALFSFSIIVFILYSFSEVHFHYWLIVLNMILFSFSIYCVCIFFTTCLKTTKSGTTAVKFYNFGSILLGFVIVLPKTSKFTKIVFDFIPQINFYGAFLNIYNLNNFQYLTWERLLLKASKMSFIESSIMYLVEIFFYLGSSIFIQKYKDSGLHFIPFIKSLFCQKISRELEQSSQIEKENIAQTQFEIHHQELSEINKQNKEQNKCLKLINISKTFGDFKAVDNFSGELFPNEIFCLLGHNGAGKSTTINMISGILDPDNGDIMLNGKSLVTNKDYLYQNIGLCQQEDIYFDYLTVEEHLEYMCRIKGSAINKKEIDDLIDKIDLAQKKNSLCSTLSGGQKRKLCIALALIGDSQIILLDEPTSGMDVMARRSLWEFLKNYKKNKILLLTTHFLDEAEYLGDRIGIMSDGHFLCSGTSSFLKSKYPCGFNINLLINSSIFNEEYKNQFFNGILNYEPNAEIKVASKGVFSLNIQSNNKHIPEIFDYIEQTKAQYGIEDYTVSSTSLEDVFLKINNKANLNDVKYLNKDENKEQPFLNDIPVPAGFCSQLKAQIVRGLYPFYRNKILFLFELLSGLGFVYIFIFFFSDFIINVAITKLNLIQVLEANKIFIYEKGTTKNFLKKSYVYDSSGFYITLSKIKDEPKDIDDFMNLIYKKALANIPKGGIYVDGSKDNLLKVYNTEVNTGYNGYFYANTMLIVSAFLKDKYKIDATILPEITYNAVGGNSGLNDILKFFTNSLSLIIICLISLFSFVIFLGGLMFEKIREKRTNIKHLLYLSGNNIWSYWIGFFIVDYIKLIIFDIFLIFPIFFANKVAIYFGIDMLAISLSSLCFIYFISFFCSKEDNGSKVLFLFIFGFMIVFIILCLLLGNAILNYIGSFTKLYYPNLLDLTPLTSMALSFIRIILSYTLYNTIDSFFNSYGQMMTDDMKDMAKEGINKITYGFGRPKEYLYTSFIAQAMNIVIYTSLLILAESGVLGKLIHRIELKFFAKKNISFGQPEDINNISENNKTVPLLNKSEEQGNKIPIGDENNIIIQNENNKIQNEPQLIRNNRPSSVWNPLGNEYVKKEMDKINTSQKELTTKISGLVKTFYSCCGRTNVRAINHLYLGLEPNEKFGLLGFNGSGKTTTFRAITNEILTDEGSVTLFGFNTKTDFERIRTMIGYCPQINPLFDFMKVREIIKFYSDLKTCNDSVESVCQKFGLSKYLDTYTINLSGGNKRKLTFAIAMMNKPRLLLLDEPSTGVDPESRRIMWRNINELSNTGHKYNMILTTHSMEEAEVLCDTVSWFKSGNFITKGNPEELKIHYSAGYKLHVKFDDSIVNKADFSNDNIEGALEKLNNMIEGINRYSNYISSNPNIGPYLLSLIRVIEKIKDKTERITMDLIGRDLSFDLIISIIKERQKDLFSEVLNMKNEDESIGEMSIAMQSLENILTSLN